MNNLEFPIGPGGIPKTVTIFFVQSQRQTLCLCTMEYCQEKRAGKVHLDGICPQDSQHNGNLQLD